MRFRSGRQPRSGAPVRSILAISLAALCSVGCGTEPETEGTPPEDVEEVEPTIETLAHGKEGAIVALAGHDEIGTFRTILGVFQDWGGHESVDEVRDFGDCQVVLHEKPEATPVRFSAGNFAIAGGNTAYVLAPDPTHTFYFDVQSSTSAPPVFSPAQSLDLAFEGHDVPGFSVPVELPNALQVHQPDLAPESDLDRKEPLVFQWTPLEPGRRLVVQAWNDATDTPVLRCIVDGAAGELTVPAAAMSALAYGSGRIGIDASILVETTIGEWEVELLVGTDAHVFERAVVFR